MTIAKTRVEKAKTKSPLGNKIPWSLGERIYDSPQEGLLFLTPAGYTKPSNRDNVSRQKVHEAICNIADMQDVLYEMWPFKKDGNHSIELLPDPNNKYDPNAIHLILRVNKGSLLSKSLDGADLGFIPAKISAQINENRDLFTGGAIFSVDINQFFLVQIALTYGVANFSKLDLIAKKRFSSILSE